MRLPQRLTPVLLLALIILVFAPVSFLYNGLAANAVPSLKNDFTSYYVAGLAVRQGMPEALYYPQPVGSLLAQASQQHPWIDLARPAGIEQPNYYLYPPLFAVLFAPMTLLPYKIAYVAWVGVGAICLALSVALMLQRLPRPGADPDGSGGGWLLLAGVALSVSLFYPVARTFAVGQSSLLLLLLMTTCMVMLSRGSARGDALAGLALAGGILLKLTPLIFIPYLVLRRRWRALGWCTGWLIALVALSIMAVGVAPHRIYFAQIVPQLSGGTAFYPNQSITGLCARLWGADFRLADLTPPGSAPVTAARVAGLLLMAAAFFCVYRNAGRGAGRSWSGADDRAFCLLLLTSLMVSPISWEHHYVMALPAAWVALRGMGENHARPGGRAAAAWGISLALIGSYVGLRVIGAFGDGGVWAQVSSSAALCGAAILWWLMARPEPGAPALGAPGRAPLQPVLIALAVFAAGIFGSKLAEYSQAYSYGDFTSYYVAAATLVEGRGDPLYYPATPDMILARAETPSPWTETAARFGVRDANYYLYPPFFAMAMTPLAHLRYETAHAAWYLINLAALAGSIWLFVRTRRSELTRAEIALAVIAVSISWPALFTFGAGQANWIVLLSLVGGLACLRAGRDAAAGLLLAGAIGVKLTPILLLGWLAWRRRWAAVVSASAALGLLVLAGWAVAGWEAYVVYAREMVPLLSRGCAHWVNESLAAFTTRLFDSPDIFAWDLARPSSLARLSASAVGLLFLAASVWVMQRASKAGADGRRLDLEFSLVTLVTLFVSPISWTHHSVLSLLAFLLLARALLAASESSAGSWMWALLLAVAFTLVNVYVKPPGVLEHGPLRALASYNLAGNALLWALVAAALLRLPAATAPQSAAS